MNVIVLDNYELLSRKAADLFVSQAQEAVKKNGRFCVALSGGDTPVRTYELLRQKPWTDQVPWNETHVFWGDERCVPSHDPRHNAWIATDILLNHVPIPAGQVHPVDCLGNPAIAASEYESILRTFFAGQDHSFDLFLLGVGTDGHTASLFPGSPVLDEQEKWVKEVTLSGQAFSRITMTIPLIEQSAMIIFMAAGSEKAPIIKRLLDRDSTERLPAGIIRPVKGDCVWLLDQAAAGLPER